MKHITLTAGVFALVLCLGATKALAVDVNQVGNQSYTISWYGIPASDNGDHYQVFFGQANTGLKDSAIALDGGSRTVTLNNLKPCTSYKWDLYSGNSGTWRKVIFDRWFTTDGSCSGPSPMPAMGNSMVTTVGQQTWTTGKTGSSTIGWSTIPSATEYHVYYRPSSSSTYIHSVVVPSNGNSITINYLTPGVQYFYRVAGVVNGVEVWLPEKTLQLPTGQKPVLGAYSGNMQPRSSSNEGGRNGILGVNDVMSNTAGATNTCTDTGWASISIRTPDGVSVDRVHVLYSSSSNNYRHALRDLSQSAHEVTISNLSTCKTYYYQVEVMGQDGRAYWQGEKVMNVHN